MADKDRETRAKATEATENAEAPAASDGGATRQASLLQRKIQRRASERGEHDPAGHNAAECAQCSWGGALRSPPAGAKVKQADNAAGSAQPLAAPGVAPLASLTSFVTSRVGAPKDVPPPPPGAAAEHATPTATAPPTAKPVTPATVGAGDATAHATAPATTGAATTTATAPATATAPVAVTDDLAQRTAIATALVVPRGSGTTSDLALVVTELVKFSVAALQALQSHGTHVAVCRNSVTDYLTTLRGVLPRGWPAGMTWDAVPGTYWAATNEVVLAVVGNGTTVPMHVPQTGEGHGSYNVVIHESTHGVDQNLGAGHFRTNSDTAFQAARTADLATLSAYESQAGNAGLQETYAESAARFFGGDPTDATTHPNLHAYWASHPLPTAPAAGAGH